MCGGDVQKNVSITLTPCTGLGLASRTYGWSGVDLGLEMARMLFSYTSVVSRGTCSLV